MTDNGGRKTGEMASPVNFLKSIGTRGLWRLLLSNPGTSTDTPNGFVSGVNFIGILTLKVEFTSELMLLRGISLLNRSEVQVSSVSFVGLTVNTSCRHIILITPLIILSVEFVTFKQDGQSFT